ncbi:CBASS cGAMP-activated phospholipase [Peribacillus tepidiphilus]|uniref:CBASS cGAMP-activated phospholipase n=1 Tax=Peribacillus tepidiphilus TaxID=2652445 RepID=UPI00129198BF|nr:CBASS cGAMP-activated phospholipase [Peribacillus tepidiphilus]
MINWDHYKAGNWQPKEQYAFKILSIDGGGMKGIIPAYYLKQVEDSIGGPIHKHFDLLTGTSTGGIICLGLTSGMSAEEIANLYINEGTQIFGKKRASGYIKNASYSNNPLKNLLIEKFANKKIRDANTMLCVPSIEHHKAEPNVFKTPHHPDYIRDGERYMWEVGLATSAAPSYFPAANIGDGECKIDGGLWANNPVLVGIAEAKKLGYSLDQIKVLSIGTGDSLYNAPNKIAEAGGLLSWKKNLVELTMQAQSKGAWHTAKYLIGENLIRLNPILTRPIPLDSTSEDDFSIMIREANHMFERTFVAQGVKEMFFQATAILQ